eukprot:scaffold1111_cov112-Isochrysis_galbana.AAC.3
MAKAASGWLIGEPIISTDPSVRDVLEMEVVVPWVAFPTPPHRGAGLGVLEGGETRGEHFDRGLV